MALTIITPPAVEPVSLADAKAQLRVDVPDEDTLIGSLIVAAREFCESFQGRAYITQTWEMYLDAWPSRDRFDIPLPPLQSVTSITYKDKDGVEATLPTTEYIVDVKSQPGRVVLAYGKSWPSITLYPVNPIAVRFSAGYGTAGQVPQSTRQAMLLLISHWYEHRETVLIGSISKEIEFAVSALLWPNRVFTS